MPPLNLVGDFGGGGMLLAFGVVCGVLEARSSGHGQVIDAAMVEGSALLATMMFGMHASGIWEERGTNMLDTGAHFYDTYECADGEYVSIGSIEPQFYAQLLELTGLADENLASQHDREAWPALKTRLAEVFLTRTRTEWCDVMEGTDVCFAPVLSWSEAMDHPHKRCPRQLRRGRRGHPARSGSEVQPDTRCDFRSAATSRGAGPTRSWPIGASVRQSSKPSETAAP